MDQSQIIYTRYLYDKTEVRHSLFLSILEHNIHEALFWGYELYYSGFEEDTFEFIKLILDTIYKESCSFITSYHDEIIQKWNIQNDPIYFGNLIATLCTKKYDLKYFCKEYLKIEGTQNEERPKNVLIVELNNDYIDEFKTKHSDTVHKTLNNVTTYGIRKDVNNLFNILRPEYEEIKNNFYNHWLYYASFSPIWEDRIIQHSGTVDYEKKTIDFIDDDKLELFYQNYGYEPDEQNKETQEKIIGKKMSKQTTIKEFCKKFCLDIPFKTKKRK